MNEAKIENFFAQKVVNNPNELSGARPANAEPANTSAITNVNVKFALYTNTQIQTPKIDKCECDGKCKRRKKLKPTPENN